MTFYKYHGAGNDFIVLNCMETPVELSQQQIAQLCHRQKGIGADGLMMLLPSQNHDFEMRYFNSDGNEGSMCGNGGRCIISFAHDMGIVKNHYEFMAVDGLHSGKILAHSGFEKTIELKMADVLVPQKNLNNFQIDTGSPHFVSFFDQIEQVDMVNEGRKIRYSPEFQEKGINVNFVVENGNQLFVRTYERGVENETLACGTGVTASAIASAIRQLLQYKSFDIKTLGGELNVRFETTDGIHFTQVFLTGPAAFVFQGQIEI